MQILQTTFEIVSPNAGMKEWHETQTQHFILRKLETCWPRDHAMICRMIIQTIPCSPFLLAQTKNQSLIHFKQSLNTFSPYLLQTLRWMQISLETSAKDKNERRCKTQSTWTMNHHESSKLEYITKCHDLDRQIKL